MFEKNLWEWIFSRKWPNESCLVQLPPMHQLYQHVLAIWPGGGVAGGGGGHSMRAKTLPY